MLDIAFWFCFFLVIIFARPRNWVLYNEWDSCPHWMIFEGSNKFKFTLWCFCIFCIQNIPSISMKLIILEIAFVFTKNVFMWGVRFIKFHAPQAILCSVKCFTRIPVVIGFKSTVAGCILSFNGMVCIINEELSRSKTSFLATIYKSKISTNV